MFVCVTLSRTRMTNAAAAGEIVCGVLVARLEEDARSAFLNETLDVLADDARGVRLEHREGALSRRYIVGSPTVGRPSPDGIFSDSNLRRRRTKSRQGTESRRHRGECCGRGNRTRRRARAASRRHHRRRVGHGRRVAQHGPERPRDARREPRDASCSPTRANPPRRRYYLVCSTCVTSRTTRRNLRSEKRFRVGRRERRRRSLTTSFTSLSAAAKSTDAERSDEPKPEPASVDGYDPSADPRAHIHRRVLDAIFNRCIYSSRVEKRCAACVWLLSLVTHAGRHPRVSAMLQDVQEAFGSLLGDQNELTQELGESRHERRHSGRDGDEAQRKELLAALMGTLNGAAPKKRHVKLDDDAEVFEEGTIAIDDKALSGATGIRIHSRRIKSCAAW